MALIPAIARPSKDPKKKTTKSTKKRSWSTDAPIFLRKTYSMIDTCNPDIASWSTDGLAFYVKDPDRFATEVIPAYFKHSNFSSFVRQLNFYGFKKIKNSETILIKDEESEESRFWRFRRDKFQRGRPDLLVHIRKTNHEQTAEKQEVDSLKYEVAQLKNALAAMRGELQSMKSLFAMMPPPTLPSTSDFATEPPTKKRKEMVDDLSDYTVVSEPDAQPIPDSSTSNIALATPLRPMQEVMASDELDSFYPGCIKAEPLDQREPSIASAASVNPTFTDHDEKILSSIFSLDFEDELDKALPELAGSMASFQSDNSVDPVQLQRLQEALSALPAETQKLFVDRIVAVIAEPDALRRQIDAITHLAGLAGREAAQRLGGVAGAVSDPQTEALASSVLGAYLSNYLLPTPRT